MTGQEVRVYVCPGRRDILGASGRSVGSSVVGWYSSMPGTKMCMERISRISRILVWSAYHEMHSRHSLVHVV